MLRRASVAAVTLFALVATTGCVVVAEDPFLDIDTGIHSPLLADLEVTWTVDQSDAAALCTAYGVRSWVVSVRGPEDRDIVVDCRSHWWSSENDLLALPEGYYSVRVRALDALDGIQAELSTSLQLVYGRGVERLHVNFLPRDFY